MQDGAILVGDAGGTNVRFAIANVAGGRVELSDIWKRPGADYPTFEAALDAFLSEAKPKIDAASFGLAGVIEDDHVELLNRGWTVDLAAVAARLNVGKVVAVNDFIAMARSAPELDASQRHELHAGKPDPQGSLAIGGPGTGFGVAILKWSEQGWIAVGGEGGHQAFTPQNDIEWKLAEHLRRAHGYVSNEMVAGGIGFDDTRDALFEIMGVKDRQLSQAEVIDAANAGDPVALELCRLRARAVLTSMGNAALIATATGGVFIAGGVSQRLEPWLKERASLDRFYKRGVRAAFMKPISISLIASEAAPLIGSAHLWRDRQARGWL